MSLRHPSGAPKHRIGALAITSLSLVTAVAGVIAWLALSAEDQTGRTDLAIPTVVLPLPPADGPAVQTEAASAPSAPSTAAPRAPGGRTRPAPAPATAEPAAAREQAALPEGRAEADAGGAAPAPEEGPDEARAREASPPKPAGGPAATAAGLGPAETESAESESAESESAQSDTAESESAETETAVLVPPVPAPPEPPPIPAPLGGGLAPAPDPALIERNRAGLLPVIGADGRQPWQVYARPFDAEDERPRIAVVITGLGLSGAATEAAIQRLPGPVTLAFAPYARELDRWIPLARAAGHEVLMVLPMEPVDYPANDPGPYALLTSLSPARNLDRLRWVLSRSTGYVGLIDFMGSRFATSERNLRPVLEELGKRGLMFVDSRASLLSVGAGTASRIGLPRAVNDLFIDLHPSRAAIDQNLLELERIAREYGYALGVGAPYPVTLERLSAWLPGLEVKGLALAPVSALADKQPD